MKISRRERLAGIATLTVPLTEAIFYHNTAPHTPAERILGTREAFVYNADITPFVGNFPESFAAPLASGIIGDYIENAGIRTNNRLLQRIGTYFPEIATSIIGVYFTLGETILPQILPGTTDARDIPAALLSALAGYSLAKIGRNVQRNRSIIPPTL